MSAIAAAYNLNGHPVEPGLLIRMLHAVPHRGPDGYGQWVRGPVGLGHAMLHTTPESLKEHQPLTSATGECCLVLDGRLDNRDALLAALPQTRRDELHTDADLVLAAYRTWGDRCPAYLLGDFAFALWDARLRRLFCARDPVGVRPLYYRLTGEHFYCASEPRQILALPGCPVRPNPGMLAEYLTGRLCTLEETWYQDMSRLRPAHWLTVSETGLRAGRYYDVDPRATIRYRTDREYADHFAAVLREAVRCRLRSHTPVGISLSGGLDSSSIAGMARGLAPEAAGAVLAYALVFDDPAADERRYIQDVLAYCRMLGSFVAGDAWIAPSTTEQLAHRRDFPDSPNTAPWKPLYDVARHHGVRVMLTGDGGDEWLTGSLWHYADLVRGLRWPTLLREYRADRRNEGVDVGDLMQYALLPLIPRPLKRAIRSLVPDVLPAWLDPTFARRICLRDRLRERPAIPPFPTMAQRAVYLGLVDGWGPMAYEMNNRLEAESGLECRLPFCDRRLIELASALPEEQRRRGTQTKYVLRQAGQAVLPDSVRTRSTKGEFSHLFVRAIERESPEARVERLRLVQEGWITAGGVRDLYRRFRFGAGDAPAPLWRILATDSWHAALFN